jgi:hypothetical protein
MGNKLFIQNFTTVDNMLMRLQPWDLKKAGLPKTEADFGYNFKMVSDVYQQLGIKDNFCETVILFDAVVGNYDRLSNLSNWGYFKSSADGSNSSCPLYDFNLAHPYQKNQYLHLLKPQLKEQHKRILMQWEPIIREFYGETAWLYNITELQQG